MSIEAQIPVQLPRIAIKFCTQCKWNLRAAYYAQELLQTFPPPALNEIALQPTTGGVFTITLTTTSTTNTSFPHPNISTSSSHPSTDPESLSDNQQPTNTTTTTGTATETHVLWDRKRDNGFPETKELKNRVRNVIDPQRDLGHIDRRLKKDAGAGKLDVDVEARSGENRVKETEVCKECDVRR